MANIYYVGRKNFVLASEHAFEHALKSEALGRELIPLICISHVIPELSEGETRAMAEICAQMFKTWRASSIPEALDAIKPVLQAVHSSLKQRRVEPVKAVDVAAQVDVAKDLQLFGLSPASSRTMIGVTRVGSPDADADEVTSASSPPVPAT